MICSKCGKELNDDAKFCTNCGNKVDNVSNIPQSGSIFDDGSDKTVYLPEENNIPEEELSTEPIDTNLGFFGNEKTVLLEEEDPIADDDFSGASETVIIKNEPEEKNLGFFGSEKTVLLEEDEPVAEPDDFGSDKTVLLKSDEPADTNLGFFGNEKTVLLDEDPVADDDLSGASETVVISNDDAPTIPPEPQNYIPEQPEPAPVYPQQPVQDYSQQPQQQMYGGYGGQDMGGAVPPMPAPMPVPQKKSASGKVGKGRIFGASIVAFFAIILFFLLSLIVCLKLGLNGGTLRKRVEKLNLSRVFNAELDGRDVAENLYDSIGFGTVTHGNASDDDLKEYIKESNFLEYAGENIENYADYIIGGKGKVPSITAEDITYDFFGENNDVADDVFGYEFRKDDLKTIRKNLEKEGVDEALSVNEWEKEIKIDPKNISYVVSYIMIGILGGIVLILLIWIVIIIDKKGRHVMGFFGNIFFFSGLITFLIGAAATAGSMIAFALTSNVVFYLASNLLLPFGILALIVGFAELVFGFIFKKISKTIKRKKKLADALKPVNQNPAPAMMYN